MSLKKFEAQIGMYRQATQLLSGNIELFKKQLAVSGKKIDVDRKKLNLFERRLGLERELFSGYEETIRAEFEKALASVERYESSLRRFEADLRRAVLEYKKDISDRKVSYFDSLLSLLNYEKDNFRQLIDMKHTMERRLLEYNILGVDFRSGLDVLEHKGKLIYEGSSRMIQRVINYNRAVAMACANITANIIRSSS